jgi:UDP-glucose 4-epimerase
MLNVVKDIEVNRKGFLTPAIMFSSSASVYGEIENNVAVTELHRSKPVNPYGNTKAITETILKDYWGAYLVQSICFRYFNAAGAEPFSHDLGQEPGATHVIARALEASINKKDFSIYGSDYETFDRTAVRDYVHVWDIARAHVLGAYFLFGDKIRKGASVFNLGTKRGNSVLEVVGYIHEKYGMGTINYEPRRLGDPEFLVADATMAKTDLGWEPEYSDLSTIIDSAYKWYTKT